MTDTNKTVVGSDIVFYTGDKTDKISVNEMNQNIKTLQTNTKPIKCVDDKLLCDSSITFDNDDKYKWRIEPIDDKLYMYPSSETTSDKFYIDGTGSITCSKLNDIDTSTISLNTHNHDTLYASIDHTHTEFDNIKCNGVTCSKLNGYNLADPSGGTSNIKVPSPPYIPTIKSDSVLEIGKYIDMHDTDAEDGTEDYSGRIICDKPTHSFQFLIDNIEVSKFICDTSASTISPEVTVNGNLTTKTINGYPILGETDKLTSYPCIPTVGWYPFHVMQNIDFHNQTDQDYIWRISGMESNRFVFTRAGKGELAYINGTYSSPKELNTTIVHNCPISDESDISDFEVGYPVFITGKVYKLEIEEGKETFHYVEQNNDPDNSLIKSNNTNSTDCIPSVKSTGTFKEFIGICTKRYQKGTTITIGDSFCKDVIINQDTIDFATHGDFYFKVNNVDDYEIGDIVLFDGNKLDMDLKLTPKITSSIVGKVTGKINSNILSIFKD